MGFSPLLLSLTAILLSFQLSSAKKSTVHFPSNSTLYWTNANSSIVQTYTFPSRLLVRVVLLTDATPKVYGNSFTFALAFYCNRRITHKCLLSVLLLESFDGFILLNRSPQIVWVANRNRPVKDNATLRAEPQKGLTLTDTNGIDAWSTNMSRDPISRMTLKADGNLVLFNSSGSIAWSSFNNPANTLVVGQTLRGHRRLKADKSNTNRKIGKFYLTLTTSSLTGFVQYPKPVAYLRLAPFVQLNKNAKLRHVEFRSSSIKFTYLQENKYVVLYRNMTETSAIQLLRLDSDGGLRVYIWESESGWRGIELWLKDYDKCQFPLACNRYGVCTRGGCTCPIGSDGLEHFTPLYPTMPNGGCCYANDSHLNSTSYSYRLMDFGSLSYFSYFDPTAATAGLTELGTCKKACDGNSTCKAAFFMYGRTASEGLCYLLPEVLTIRGEPIKGPKNSTVAFIKVPILSVSSLPQPSQDGKGDSSRLSPLSIIAKVLAIAISISICAIISRIIWWKIKQRCPVTDCLEQVIGGPMRFSYKELCLATGKFSKRLGRGGFGAVFKGEQKDGTPIAVKRLDCVEQGKGEFLAEMQTMGSIHHVNLVKLLGFCADESNRLLVYEYMSNSSLDKWIFSEDRKQELSWETRRRIILDVARGLTYLHEECNKRIAHLDVKPHNILLDENFNAKISDFGLARFIDRNQSHVVTGMRGTLGYLAPEWQHSRITVKVDVYSFGIVVLEVLSGRMNIDYSQEDSDVNLLGILQRKASEDRLTDIIDKKIADSECHEEDILKTIKIASWCLNEDPSKRPNMSTVVKVMEGTMEIEQNIDFKFAHVLVLSCKSSTIPSCKSQLSQNNSC